MRKLCNSNSVEVFGLWVATVILYRLNRPKSVIILIKYVNSLLFFNHVPPGKTMQNHCCHSQTKNLNFDAGFTFESGTCLRQMLQYPRQTVHLHQVADIVGDLSATCLRQISGNQAASVSDVSRTMSSIYLQRKQEFLRIKKKNLLNFFEI